MWKQKRCEVLGQYPKEFSFVIGEWTLQKLTAFDLQTCGCYFQYIEDKLNISIGSYEQFRPQCDLIMITNNEYSLIISNFYF